MRYCCSQGSNASIYQSKIRCQSSTLYATRVSQRAEVLLHAPRIKPPRSIMQKCFLLLSGDRSPDLPAVRLSGFFFCPLCGGSRLFVVTGKTALRTNISILFFECPLTARAKLFAHSSSSEVERKTKPFISLFYLRK